MIEYIYVDDHQPMKQCLPSILTCHVPFETFPMSIIWFKALYRAFNEPIRKAVVVLKQLRPANSTLISLSHTCETEHPEMAPGVFASTIINSGGENLTLSVEEVVSHKRLACLGKWGSCRAELSQATTNNVTHRLHHYNQPQPAAHTVQYFLTSPGEITAHVSH